MLSAGGGGDRDTPNGKKISIALEEMGLEHVTKPINIGSNVDQFTDDFKAVRPCSPRPSLLSCSLLSCLLSEFHGA